MLHVKKRVVVQCRVRELQDTGIGISLDRGQLLEAVGEVQVGIGIIDPPAQLAPPSPVRIRAGIGSENDPREGEYILLETRCISPLGSASAVGSRLAGGAKAVLVHHQSTFDADEVPGFTNAAARTWARQELRAADASG